MSIGATIQQKLAQRGLVPKSLVAWITVYCGGLWIVLESLRLLTGRKAGALETGYSFVTLILVICLFILVLRWVRTKLMWRLRNRLIVTYVFIGVIPLVLVGTMALLAAYLFAGQFSSFVVTNDVQAEIKRLAAVNALAAQQIDAELKQGKDLTPKIAIESESDSRQLVAYYRGKPVVLRNGELKDDTPAMPPETPELNSICIENDRLYLRAVTRLKSGRSGNEPLTVVSSLPITSERLGQITSNIGVISVFARLEGERAREVAKDLPEGKGVYVKTDSANDREMKIKIGDTYLDPRAKVSYGTLPPPKSIFDRELPPLGSLQNAVEWRDGSTTTLFVKVETRVAMLYSRLFRTVGETADLVTVLLAVVGVFFAFIELIALIIGVRLTRTMTASVAELYNATQHVNAGNFSHRIVVRSRDQLAALETSFNSMTESLEKLIAEQKEKQRIESELAIAQEVQALLFPKDINEIDGLEVHGVCRPARTVSGDYYDFLPVSATRLGLAVGDISGKGISAALLMATVHAFVRAYTLVEQVPALAEATAAAGGGNGSGRVLAADSSLPPGTLLSMLNQQLYQSTPTEKYATMFLGFYDQTTRSFNYSNAGHLPPLIISTDGSVCELGTGGTVVGLFGEMTYPDACVQMKPGDIFVAYSDGVTEPENEFGEFGAERLAALIQQHRDQSLVRIADTVLTAVGDWIGSNEQPDDVTLVLARAR